MAHSPWPTTQLPRLAVGVELAPASASTRGVRCNVHTHTRLVQTWRRRGSEGSGYLGRPHDACDASLHAVNSLVGCVGVQLLSVLPVDPSHGPIDGRHIMCATCAQIGTLGVPVEVPVRAKVPSHTEGLTLRHLLQQQPPASQCLSRCRPHSSWMCIASQVRRDGCKGTVLHVFPRVPYGMITSTREWS